MKTIGHGGKMWLVLGCHTVTLCIMIEYSLWHALHGNQPPPPNVAESFLTFFWHPGPAEALGASPSRPNSKAASGKCNWAAPAPISFSMVWRSKAKARCTARAAWPSAIASCNQKASKKWNSCWTVDSVSHSCDRCREKSSRKPCDQKKEVTKTYGKCTGWPTLPYTSCWRKIPIIAWSWHRSPLFVLWNCCLNGKAVAKRLTSNEPFAWYKPSCG